MINKQLLENRLQKFVNRIYGKKVSPVKQRIIQQVSIQQISNQQVSKEQQYEDIFEKRINELYMNSGQPSQRETSRIRAQVEEEVIQSFRNPTKRGYSLMDSSQHVSKYYQVLDTKREQLSSSFLIRRSQPNLSNSKEQKPKREQLFRRVNSLLSERKVRASVYQNQINYHQNVEQDTIDIKQVRSNKKSSEAEDIKNVQQIISKCKQERYRFGNTMRILKSNKAQVNLDYKQLKDSFYELFK